MAEKSVLKTLLVLVLVLVPLLAVSEADPEVSCVFRQNCLLPCQIQFNSDLVIHWSNASSAGDSVVHSYYDRQDQLGQQNQNFKDRTSLIQDQISRGNASLLLKEVKIQDEGRYKCNTSTSTGHKESFINLKTDAPVSDIRIHQDGNRIPCSSEGIYPQPELTWSTEPPSNTALQNRTTIHQTEDQLYDISSSLTGPDEDPGLTYSCNIRTRSNNMIETFKKPGRSHQEDSPWWLIGGPVAAVAGLIKGVLVGFLCKRCKSKKSKNGSASQSASGGNPENKKENKMSLLNSNTEGSDSKQELRKQDNKEDFVIEEPRETDPLFMKFMTAESWTLIKLS